MAYDFFEKFNLIQKIFLLYLDIKINKFDNKTF